MENLEAAKISIAIRSRGIWHKEKSPGLRVMASLFTPLFIQHLFTEHLLYAPGKLDCAP